MPNQIKPPITSANHAPLTCRPCVHSSADFRTDEVPADSDAERQWHGAEAAEGEPGQVEGAPQQEEQQEGQWKGQVRTKLMMVIQDLTS